MPGIGKVQRSFLRAMRDHSGTYKAGGGWTWDNASTSKRIAESLVRRGLATKKTYRRWDDTGDYTVYSITDAGRAAIERTY